MGIRERPRPQNAVLSGGHRASRTRLPELYWVSAGRENFLLPLSLSPVLFLSIYISHLFFSFSLCLVCVSLRLPLFPLLHYFLLIIFRFAPRSAFFPVSISPRALHLPPPPPCPLTSGLPNERNHTHFPSARERCSTELRREDREQMNMAFLCNLPMFSRSFWSCTMFSLMGPHIH